MASMKRFVEGEDRRRRESAPRASGNLRIGDHWNAITIIALSQSNPLKAVAELVENSIDARAKTIVITRGRAVVLTPEELAWRLGAGKATLVVEPIPLFDRAVSAALDSFASGKGPQR